MKKLLLLLTCFFFASVAFAQTDLVITNSNDQEFYVAGTSAVYTIKVTNFGPAAATNVHVVNPIPSGITTFYWEGSNFSFGSNTNLDNTVPTLAVGEILTYTIHLDIPNGYSGPLTSTANVSMASPGEVNASSNQAIDTDQIANADVVVTNTDYTNVYASGQNSVYTLTVANNGPTAAIHVVVKNDIPLGLDPENMSWTGSNGTSGTGVILTDVIELLPAGENVIYTVTLAIPSTFNAIVINKATVYTTSEDPTEDDHEAIDTDVKAFGADLVIVNTDNQDTYTAGQPRVYTVTVTNAGPDPATDVEVYLPAPAGTTITTWSGTNSSSGTAVLENTITSLAVGSTVTYTVTLDIPSGFTGDLVTQVTVSSAQSDPNPCTRCIDTDTAGANIQVSNTDNKTTYISGSSQVYTVTVSNAGPSAAENVHVTNTFPSGVTITSWMGSNGSNGGGTFDDVIASLGNGETVTYTITAAISPSFTGNLTSQVNITSDTIDPVPGCTQCSDMDTQLLADVSVTNTDGTTLYNIGVINNKAYTVTVTNNGPTDTRNIQVSYTIPPTATQVSWTGSNGTSGTGTLNNIIASLASGASVVYTVSLKIPATFTGNFTTTANAGTTITNDTAAANNSAADTDTPQNTADVVIVNTDSQETYTAGGSNVYSVTVTNNGPSTATGINVAFPLPAGTTSMSWTGNSGGGPGPLTNTIATLAAGQTVTYTVTVNIPVGFTGNLTAHAEIVSTTSIDPDTSCGQCNDVDTGGTPSADVVITNTDNQGFYVANSTRVYTVTVTNNGPQSAAQVHIENPLPVGITTMSWTASNGTNGTGPIDVIIPTMGNGASIVYTITVTIPASFTGNLVNTATVSTTPVDSSPANNLATDTDVPSQSDIVVTNTATDPNAAKGSTTQFIVTVTNNGPQNASSVAVSNPIPAGVTNMTWTGSNGATGTGALNDIIQFLAVGSSVTYTITITVPYTASVSSTATSTLSADPNAVNSQATATITPTTLPGNDVVVTISDGFATYIAGQNRVFTVTVTNNGPSNASNINVSSIVPEGLGASGYSWSGNSASGNTGINNIIANLNSGQSVTYTITVIIPADFPQNENLINTVSAIVANNDPTTANNTATDIDTPTPFANLVVKKTDGRATYEQSGLTDDKDDDTIPPILRKEYVTYTITIVNYGPSDSYNIDVTDNIPVNTNVAGTQIAQTDVEWSGNGASGTGDLEDTIDHLAVGEIVTYTVVVYIPQGFQVYSTPQVDSNLVNTASAVPSNTLPSTFDPVLSNNSSTDTDTPSSRFLFISNDPVKYSVNGQASGLAQGYIENILVRSHCAQVSNFEMRSGPPPPTGLHQPTYGVGYFNRNSSDFPIEDGIVLTSGDVLQVSGPNDPNVNSNGDDWTGDTDLSSPSLQPPVGVNNNELHNPVYLKFNFVPSAQELKFNFIFSADEYSVVSSFECTYSDVFAFILTDLTDNTPAKNLAVLPNINPPTAIKVTNIHRVVAGCPAINQNFFGKHNFDTSPPEDVSVRNSAAIDVNGQTKLLEAKSTVIPGHLYSIKLVIANKGDGALNSSVFIEGGSFKFDAEITGSGPLAGLNNFTGANAICDGQSRRIQYGENPLPNATYSWLKNGVKIDGESNYYYDVTEPGVYTAVVTFSTGCQKMDDIEVEFTAPLPTREPFDVPICAQDPPFVFNIDQTDYILNNFSPSDYPISYYENEQDAIDEGNNDILSLYGNLNYTINTPMAQGETRTIYVRIADQGSGSNCVLVKPIVLSRIFSEGEISYPAGPHCTGGGTVNVTPTAAFTQGGYYEATPSGLGIDFLTGAIDLDNNNSQPGSYTIKYKIPGGTCPAYESQPVTFDVSACLVTVIEQEPPVCAGDTFDLQTSAVNQPGVTYTWSDANGVIGITNVPQLDLVNAPTIAGNYDYTVVVSTATESSAPSTMTLVVHAIPTATISGPNNVCTNGNADILISGTPGASVTYNDGNADTTVVLNSSGEYPFTVAVAAQITFQLGEVASATNPICSQTLTSASPDSSLTITVGLPDAEITGPANAVFCIGGAVDITVHGASDATVHYTITNSSGTTNGPPLLLDAAGDGTITATGLTEDTTYELIDVTTSCFNTITDESLLVTVHASPDVTSFTTSTPTVCENTSATLNFIGTPGATINYKDNFNNTYSVLIPASGNATQQTPQLQVPTTFTLVNVVSVDLCTKDLNLPAVPIAIATNPVITSQPNTPAAICETQSFTITVQATGTDLHYIWYHDNVPVIPAVDSNVYTKVSTFSDNGDYRVEISGQCTPPAAIAVSNTVHVTIHDLHISSQPAVLTEVCPDDDVTLNVGVQGSGVITYDWRKGGISLAAPNLPQLELLGVTAADAGIYTCLVSNGTCSILSEQAEVRVHVAPSISVQPALTVDKCTSPTDSFTLSVTADGTAPLSYQWTRSGTNVGTNSPTLTVTPLTLADAGQYKVVVTGLCGLVESTVTEVNITEAPTIVSQPSSPELCSGPGNSLLLHVGITGGGSDVHYQWQRNNQDVGTDSPDYSVPVPAVEDSGVYICRISNGACPPIFTNPVTVVVNPAPRITQQPVSRTVCVDEMLTLFVEVETVIPVHYLWFHDGVEVGGDSPTYTVANAALTDAGTYRCIISSDTCPTVYSHTVTVGVRPLPDASIANGAQSTICDNTGTDVIFTGTPNAVVTYTVNSGEEQTITLNPSGSARLLTGVLEESTTYSLVSVAANDNPPCPKILTGEAIVTVMEIPDPELDQEGYICLDPVTGQTMTGSFYELNTGLSTADGYTFVWYHDDVEILGATEGAYSADAEGTYEVEITDTATGCTDSATAPIVTSTPPLTITADVVTGYFEENATVVVTATPAGEYEYRLDDGPWQTDNVFTGVRTVLSINTSGDHIVYVRDTKACDELSYDVKVIDYPKYFTPNGDGFHDTWNISVLSNQPNAKIYIFDRFGKLLKQISTTNPTGWDGTYNGQPMTADDYWFVVKYMEQGINKEFRAHFTLKR